MKKRGKSGEMLNSLMNWETARWLKFGLDPMSTQLN